MKKTQTIVDRERLSSGYIESKQDFSNVLSQVKLLPTTTWKSPWFYGPIGIAVFSVTISIVSLNPSTAIASSDVETKDVVQKKAIVEVVNKEDLELIKEENLEVEEDVKTQVQAGNKPGSPKTKTVEKEAVSLKIQESLSLENLNPVETEVVEKKVSANNRFPHIDGYFTGEIPVESLFDEKGILLNETVQVVSFDLNFFTGRSNVVNHIKGNRIPSEMRSMITNFNIGKQIFITNIKAFDRDGRSYTLPSVNLTPTAM